MVDARGGAMRGCRHSGVRVIIPPGAAPMPMRITCRYLRRERLVHPPPLMEGEACASKIMEVGPAGAKFLGPVLIEVPHFASLCGKQREIIILRSDSGEVWREHLVEAEDELVDEMIRSGEEAELRIRSEQTHEEQENWRPASALGGRVTPFDGYESATDNKQQSAQQQQEKRLTRIVTTEFPQYFAIISRIRQEVHTVGPDGSTVDSQVVPKVQAIFTEGALTKRIKIGLQNKTKQDQQDVPESSQSPELNARAQSPASQQSTDGSTLKTNSRPGSKTRRRRFLACFGASHGSRDQLNDGAMSSSNYPTSSSASSAASSSIGGDSPRVPVNEKLVERRIIIEDVSDSEEARDTSLEAAAANTDRPRKKRHVQVQIQQLVPDDYYIEQEPPLILNMEPKTYGKRLADCSVQTDPKSGNIAMSTRANGPTRRGLLGGRRRRNKQQLTIHCAPPSGLHYEEAQTKPKLSSLRDSSITPTNEDPQQQYQKSRTCTIQTDSDSVIVNYVTVHPNSADAATQVINDDGYVSGSGELKKQHHEHRKGLFSPFCASARVEEEEDEEQQAATAGADDASGSSLSVDEQMRDAKSKKAAAKSKKKKSVSKKEKKSSRNKALQESKLEPKAAEVEIEMEPISIQSDGAAAQAAATSGGEDADESLTTSTTTRSMSPTSKELKLKIKLDKQEKAKRDKLEKQLRKEAEEAAAKAEKERKRVEKEAKKAAKKLPVSQSTVAAVDINKQLEEQPTAPVAEQKSSGSAVLGTITKTIQSVKFAPSPKKSYKDDERSSPIESVESAGQIDDSIGSSTVVDKTRQEDGHDMIRLSIGGGISESPDTADLVHIENKQAEAGGESTSDDQSQQVAAVDKKGKKSKRKFKISLPDAPDMSKFKLPLLSGHKSSTSDQSTSQEASKTVEPAKESHARVPLKPILKQSPAEVESGAETAEIIIGEPSRSLSSVARKLVSEATDEAVRAADELQNGATVASAELEDSSMSVTSPISESPASLKKIAKQKAKEEREKFKQLSRSISEDEKRLAKEAKKLAKEAEAARKRAENEANKAVRVAVQEAQRQADIARIESERAIKASELASSSSSDSRAAELEDELKKVTKLADKQAKRIAKEAEQEARRIQKQAEQEAKKRAKLAKAEASQLAKESKEKLKLASSPVHSEKLDVTETPIKSIVHEETATTTDATRNLSSELPEQPDHVEQELAQQTAEIKEIESNIVEIEPEATPITDESEKSERDHKSKSKSPKSSKSFGISLPKFGISPRKSPKKESYEKVESSSAPAAEDDQAEAAAKSITQINEENEEEEQQAESTSASNKAALVQSDESKADSKTKSISFSFPKLSLGKSNKAKATETKDRIEAVETEAKSMDDEESPPKSKSPKSKKSFGISLPFGSSPSKKSEKSEKDEQPATSVVEEIVSTEIETTACETGPVDVTADVAISAATTTVKTQDSVVSEEASSQDKEQKKDKQKKKKDKKGKKKSKATKSTQDSESSDDKLESTASQTTNSKAGFFSRLFSSKSAPATDVIPVTVSGQVADKIDQDTEAKQKEPYIMSEMYPSDPNDADGEMILEVNVPQNVIEKIETRTNSHPDTSEVLAQQLASTTSIMPTSTDQEDQEATLVNISQMADDEDADEATENVASQTNDLDGSIVQVIEQADVAQQQIDSPTSLGQSVEDAPSKLDTVRSDVSQVDVVTPETSDVVKQQVVRDAQQRQSVELKDEKKRHELEAKLEKEAKKQEKEEQAAKKKQEKEAKKLAEAKAKKQAQDEKIRKKRDAEEAKRQAKEAKLRAKNAKKAEAEQAKLDKKNKRNNKSKDKVAELQKDGVGASTSIVTATEAIPTSNEPEVSKVKTTMVSVSHDGSDQPIESASETVVTTTSGGVYGDDEGNLDIPVDMSNMAPVSEESEIEKIVEEVVGDDGTVTKRTKVVETKYVTLRQEEIRVGERRDIPVEEWERMQADEKEHQLRSRASSTGSESSIVERIKVEVERTPLAAAVPTIRPVGPYEHKDLDEIRTTPSYFTAERPSEIKADLTPKRELKKRFKLNRRLIKRANKLAKSEAKRAKVERRKAESEIAVCDEAARHARKELKRALKESHRANKIASKLHKKMDKFDKKLAKQAQKLEKRQKKIDKKTSKLAKKAAKKQAKLDKKAEKERKKRGNSPSSSGTSSSKRASIKREEISAPILKSSSRFSIGGTEIVQRTPSVAEIAEVNNVIVENEQQPMSELPPTVGDVEQVDYTMSSAGMTEGPGGEQHVDFSEQTLTGREAEEAALRLELEASREEQEAHRSDSDDVIVDVVGLENEPELQQTISTPSSKTNGAGERVAESEMNG